MIGRNPGHFFCNSLIKFGETNFRPLKGQSYYTKGAFTLEEKADSIASKFGPVDFDVSGM